ncbi:uncharacterized protein CANTADRAFT_105640 [Suhomyces tanzawaensis NRRL Y-17324]|uniref:Uncharacterized protein n=1 Tax=Suhomyces tanzawaensis NRRL Y-17324 TaxID=984487 RepID=A0A1E4SPD8_9ASCO|nr:uncharacterized protein CANTADRAFT_105640 [Suhomyces tanzawaensis NRRL Y-17324]ODV81389.1 hypothetical protein CANTADRAFT_105640 [Suhomyces tanzawaensis NRRL Y-17324]
MHLCSHPCPARRTLGAPRPVNPATPRNATPGSVEHALIQPAHDRSVVQVRLLRVTTSSHALSHSYRGMQLGAVGASRCSAVGISGCSADAGGISGCSADASGISGCSADASGISAHCVDGMHAMQPLQGCARNSADGS